MPMYWPAFWNAVEGQEDSFIVAYERLLSHYWHHTKCQGLKDDDNFLRRLARKNELEWVELRPLLLDGDKYFWICNGVWHQKRALEEWGKAFEAYQKKLERTKEMNRARWGSKAKKEYGRTDRL